MAMMNVNTAQNLLRDPGLKLDGVSKEARRALDEARGSLRMTNGDAALFERLQIVDDEKHFTYALS